MNCDRLNVILISNIRWSEVFDDGVVQINRWEYIGFAFIRTVRKKVNRHLRNIISSELNNFTFIF